MSTLGAFSEALVAPGKPQSDVLPDAIPDIWGKALTFAHSLSDEKHIFHGRSVASFRGFLAMLAFRHIYRYNLTALRVEFSPNSVHMFESVLARRSEAEGMVEPDGDSAGWNPAYVFLLDEQAIGMCSPLTLITPQEGFHNIDSRLSWLTDGFRFTDPTARLGFRQSAVLNGWLERLQVHVATSARRGIWRNVLLHQLSAFQGVLSRKSGRASSPIEYALGDFGIKAELFEPLGKALAPSEDEGKSPFELLATRRRSDRTLVVDEEIIRDLPASSEIIGEITAAVLKDQPLGVDKTFLGHYPLPPGWRWIRPAEFLLPQLTMIELQDSFVNVAAIPIYQGHASDGSPLPPLHERVTEYLDADVIAKNCWFQRTAEGFTFGLSLPVAGDERIEAKKCYKFADIREVSCYELPVVEIWPCSKMADWNCYYTFWGTEGFENELYICPSGAESAPEGKLTGPNRQQVTLTREFPQYLTCFLLSNSSVSRRTQLGLLMPTLREQPPTGLPRTLNIGFDFGSTNTHVMFAGEHGAPPEPLTIHPSSLQILRVESFRRESLMYQFFIPSNGESAPFASLIRRRVPLTIGFEALRDAHVLFPHPNIAGKQFDDLNLGCDLKWGGPELNSDRNAFLLQFVLHIAYEARLIGANRLCFFYSYPSSYDESTRELIRTFWGSKLASLSSVVGVPCELGGSQTESVASAFYFSRKFRDSAIFENAATVLDIGGHTSDISVWRQGRLEIQASVPFSGREILVCPLEKNRQYMLEMLSTCIENGQAIIEPLGLLSGVKFMTRAEAILRAHGNKLLYGMSVLYGAPGFGQFRSQVALRLATLVYYAGLLLRRRKWAASGIPLPDIYIGGNGSRSLHWLAPPFMQPDHPMMGLLSLAYSRGAGFDSAPSENRIFLSKEPKWEVAYGMHYSENNSLAGQDQFIEVVSGESFESEGEMYLETEPLTTALLQAGVRIKRAQELQSALSLYNEFAETRRIGLLPVRNNAEVVERAQSAINEWARRKVGDNPRKMRVEPAFIIGSSNALPIAEW